MRPPSKMFQITLGPMLKARLPQFDQSAKSVACMAKVPSTAKRG